MRGVLTWLAAFSCTAAAVELPPHVQALLGMEPYAEYAAAGMPQPLTAEQVAELPLGVFQARGSAIKRVLYRGMARTRAARWRETEQNLAMMARDAEQSGLLPELSAVLAMQADGNMPRAVAYTLRRVREELVQLYAVDELQMRLLLDSVDADEEQAERILQHLPLHAVFNMVPQTPVSGQRILADMRLFADILARAADALSRVHNAESAVAVLPELERLLLLHDTTLSTRAQLLQGLVRPDTPELEAAAAELGRVTGLLREQRMRLDEQAWFGCKELQALEFLLN